MASHQPIRVIIAEDHTIFRTSLIMALQRYKQDMEVVGEAANGQQLVELTASLLPDVVLTDIQMPVMDGLQAVKILRQLYPHMGIIALTLLGDVSVVKNMVSAGVNGYLLKNCNLEDLYKAVQEVHNGRSYYDKEVQGMLVKYQ